MCDNYIRLEQRPRMRAECAAQGLIDGNSDRQDSDGPRVRV